MSNKPLTEFKTAEETRNEIAEQRASPEKPESIVRFLELHGLTIKPPMVLLIYGPPKVGKTVLALQIARELDLPTKVFYAEPNYKNPDFQELLKKYMPRQIDLQEISKPWFIFYMDKYVKDNKFVVIDSVSAIGEMVGDELKTFENLVYTSRTALVGRRIAFRMQRLAAEKNLIVVLIAQATGSPQKYKGVSYKPSMTMKSMHYTDYDILLEPVNMVQRRLTIVNARPKPWLEGKKFLLAFTEHGIKPLGEEVEHG